MWDKFFHEVKEQSWSTCSGLLMTDEIKLINRFIDDHRDEFGPALIGHEKEKSRVESVRGDFTYWIDPLSPPKEFEKVIVILNSLKEELNKSFFLGLKEFECHLAYYPEGAFYKKHLDRFERDSSRAFSFIFYLNDDWKEENHGELVIYNKQGEVLSKVLPVGGTMVGFMSEDLPHEVMAGTKERRSLTGWMHTKLLY